MGIDMGLKKTRNDRDAKKAYGDDDEDDEDYDEVTEIYFVVCSYKTQFDNAAKMLSWPRYGDLFRRLFVQNPIR